jgi:histidyl-tRNA synthetase
MDYKEGSLKSQFKKADLNNALFTLILGDNELNEGKINIKDNTLDTQETINIEEVYNYILSKVNQQSHCSGCNK